MKKNTSPIDQSAVLKKKKNPFKNDGKPLLNRSEGLNTPNSGNISRT